MFLLALILGLAAASGVEEGPGTMLGGKLNGHVKSVADTTAVPGTPEVIERRKYSPDGCMKEYSISTGQESAKIFISACDGNGHKIEEREYIQHDNNARSITTFRYDTYGNLTEEQSQDGNGKVRYIHSYTYEGRHLTEEKSTDGTKVLNQRFYTYDAGGNMVRDSSSEGKTNTSREFKHDAKGRLLEFTVRDCRKGSCNITKETYKRDAKGNEIEMVHTETDTTKNFKNVSVYEDTMPVEMRQYKSRGLNFIRTLRYDKRGNIIETTYHSYLDSRPANEKYTYEWNEHGDKVKEIGYNPDGTESYTWIFEYEYDHAGNMLRQTRVRNGERTVITRRRIEYY
jgi:YD repeat-containing protein